MNEKPRYSSKIVPVPRSLLDDYEASLSSDDQGDRPVMSDDDLEARLMLAAIDAKAAVSIVRELVAEVRRLRQQIAGHCDRIARQSELLSQRAEK
jgi:hypothetical protein